MPANQIRIIGGRHRGRRLGFVPVGGLRPTPDRVRETLFNWLQADVHGARCLDLFAGSGALGLEAVSRGAAVVHAVEQNRQAAQRLRENIALLGEQDKVEVHQADALRYLRHPPALPFDIVFADPPFDRHLLPRIVAALQADGWLGPGAVVYLEQDARRDWPKVPAGWRVDRGSVAGQTAQQLLRRSIGGEIIGNS